MLDRLETSGRSRPHLMAAILGIASALVGAGYLVAWLAGMMGDRGFSAITMKTNAALCLFLAGAALILLSRPKLISWERQLLNVCAATVLLIGGLTLTENLFNWDLGIDQLIATEPPGALGVVDPNRMGMPACLSLILAGAALLMLARDRGRTHRPLLAQVFALGVCLIALLSTLGFLYGARQLHAVARFTAVAWPTALTLLALGIGLLLARPFEGLMSQVMATDAGGANIRHLLVPAILLPLCLGWLRLEGERLGLFDGPMGTALVILTFTVVFAALVYRAGRQTSESSAALMKSERQFRSLFESMNEGFALNEILYDESGRPVDYRFLDVNPAFERLTRLRRDEVVGRTRTEVLASDDRKPLDLFGRVALTGAPLQFENYSPTLQRHFEVFAYRPAPGRFAMIFMDISERKRAEETIRASEQRLGLALDAAGAASWEVNLETGQHTWDQRFMALLRVPPEALAEVEQHWADLVLPEDQARAVAELAAACQEGGPPYDSEFRARRMDGAVRWFHSRGVVMHGPGSMRRMVGVLQDITERKQAEEKLREINRTLEQRVAERTAEAERRAEELRGLAGELARTEQREQRRLAQWLHDDLQQLLVATKMQIALIQSAVEDPGLRRLVEKASRLIDESIGQSRALTSEISPPVLFESGLVPGIEQLARWMEEKHNLHVTVESSADVSAENQDAAVVLFNATRELLFNVVKHAGVSEAKVSLTEKEGRLQLCVEDQGVGFEPSVRRGAKTGFGLLNVRERVRLVGGELQVRSVPGRGTCVTLLASAGPGQAGADRESAASESVRRNAVPADPRVAEGASAAAIRILLVDDHLMVRQGLASLLANEAGIEVVGQAGDGYEAVKLASQVRPDVVTMDISLPGMNGIEATRRIKSELPNVRVIGLSMHGEKEQAAAMYQAGADAYVSKGGPREALVTVIRKIALAPRAE